MKEKATVVRSRKLDVGFIKINCDTLWNEQTNTSAIRVITRDENGRIVGGLNC